MPAGRWPVNGAGLKQFPEHEANIRAFYGRWEEMLGGPIQEAVDILHHLKYKTDYRLYALTNWSAETFPVALKRYDFLHCLKASWYRAMKKTRKPFLPIYQTLLSRFHIDPATAVYTDDNVRNLHPPKELGLHTIHFQSPQQFKKDLQELGVSV